MLNSIERAVSLVQAGECEGLVTNPIQKSALYEAGFGYPGHTEYLAALADMVSEPVMMLAGGGLRVVPVTIHLPLRDAIETLSTEMIVQCGRVTAAGLKVISGSPNPGWRWQHSIRMPVKAAPLGWKRSRSSPPPQPS